MKRKPQQLNIQPKQKRKPKEKAKRGFTKNPDDYPCPVCGESDFEWGHVTHTMYYTQTNLWGAADNLQALRARICLACGHMMTFLEG